MDKIKRIICVESIVKYKTLINVFKDRYPDIQVMVSLDMLEKEIKSNPKTDITLVFLDNVFVSKISKEIQYQFNFDNNICIAISNDSTDLFKREPYIYDLLVYNDTSSIFYFLKRLEKDMDYRLQLLSATSDVKEFYRIGQNLTSERDVNALMGLIVDASMKMTSADAGSLYIVVNSEENKDDDWSFYEKNSTEKFLKFVVAKNKSINLGLQSSIIPILKDSIVGHAVLKDQPIRIEDAYDIPSRFEYKFNSKFDDLTGYKTKSILTVPMKDHQDRILGVIQLINKKRGEETVPFTFKDEVTIYSLAGQASIALENNILYKDMENLISKYKETIDEEIAKRSETDKEINKLLSAIEHSPSTVVITDSKGYIEYVNPKFTEMTGYKYKEVVGKKPNIFKADYHRQEDFYEQLWMKVVAGEEWRGEFLNKKKNGDDYWESISISSLKDTNDKIKYIIIVEEDITEKKRMTTELTSKNKELNDTIQKLKETQLQLIQKEKMVGIGHLASGIAHEINNPLGFILSNNRTLKKYMTKFKELLSLYQGFIKNNIQCNTLDQFQQFENIKKFEEDNNLDFLLDDLVELFNDTNNGLEKVKAVVDALRRFSTIDQLNDYEEYELNQGIKSSILVLKHEMKDIEINEELDEVPSFLAIGGEMNQVILNLISNSIYAIKQKREEQGQINIKTWYEGKNVFCEIIDNGIGIPKENIKNIFNPFYTTKPEGMGLGLSFAYDVVVKKHKGYIKVKSDRGVGTKFTIQIPIKIDKKS